jgi:hypothetical protein
MAAKEGFRRMYLIGKAVLALGVLLDLFLIIGLIAAAFGATNYVFAIGVFGIPPTVSGLTILAATWVAEGFLTDRRSSDRQRAPSAPIPEDELD